MAVLHINEEEFKNLVAEDKVTMVDFYADWCGPCNMMGPIVEMLGDDFPEANICKVNVDKYPGLAMENGISSIPAFLFFKNGELKEKIVGAVSKSELIATINQM